MQGESGKGWIDPLHYRDGRLQSVTGTAVQGVRYDYGIEFEPTNQIWSEYRLETKLDVAGNATSEWTKTYTDSAGQEYRTVYSDGASSVKVYNNQGLVVQSVDPDGVSMVYGYDNSTKLMTLTAEDLDRDGWGYGGNDRYTSTSRYVDAANSGTGMPDVVRILNERNGSSLRTSTMTSTDGLRTWRVREGNNGSSGVSLTNYTLVTPGTTRTVLNVAEDGTSSLSTYSFGRLMSVARYNAAGGSLGGTSYSYDAYGRQKSVTDARAGTTSYTYNDADQVVTVTQPAPAPGQSSLTTTTSYDSSRRAWKVTQPDGGAVTNLFYTNGLLRLTYGSRTYPVGYGYDYAGRMTAMTNWSGFGSGSGARVTTWSYDANRGWLNNKRYPNASTGSPGTVGPDYTYTPGGRLKTRAWARVNSSSARVTTRYTYGFDDSVTGNDGADLMSVAYENDPQSTSAIAYTYDACGRQYTVTQGDRVTTYLYNEFRQALTETMVGGALDGLAVVNSYDGLLRRTNLALATTTYSTNLYSADYGYEAGGRLGTVSTLNPASGLADVAAYSYVANSSLVGQIAFSENGASSMTTSKSYDLLSRLTNVVSTPVSAVAVSSGYAYNSASQRVRNAQVDGSYWVYGYDALGQVISGKKYWSDGTPVAGQQFEYAFDDIGNRQQTKAGGDASGANLRSAAYTANALNQYTSRDVPGGADVVGVALATNTVYVNAQSNSVYRHGEYFRKEMSLNNTNLSLWTNVVVGSAGQTDVSGSVFLPKMPEAFSYDADGNLTNDGRWSYVWDAENRLISMQALSSVPSGAKLKIGFGYDAKGRRIQKTVSTWNSTTLSYQLSTSKLFVYDGWNLIAELSSSSSATRTYVWGSDLSGSIQGAGGVGGLLFVSDLSTINNQPSTHAVSYDGNGNVMGLVNVVDGTTSAKYEYGPFGEVIRATGPMAKANPFRFSTKYQDDETDLLYYGYRYYNASTGRWINRDPYRERGGLNLYGVAMNDFIDRVDVLGRDTIGDYFPGFPHILPPPPEPPVTLSTSDQTCPQDVIDAIAKANAAMNRGKCGKWFIDHGKTGGASFSVNCYGKCKAWCLLGKETWTFPGSSGIGVCRDNIKGFDATSLASLLIHEAAHHACTIGPGREACAESAQDACADALSGQE
jgi:RHS repeat-associated protein